MIKWLDNLLIDTDSSWQEGSTKENVQKNSRSGTKQQQEMRRHESGREKWIKEQTEKETGK